MVEKTEQEHPNYLPALCAAIKTVHNEGEEITTASFAALMDVAVRVFDHMGSFMSIAKHEMMLKTGTLHAAAPKHPSLRAMVEADKAAGKATVKDSCARNLHRLICAIKFVRVLLEQFSANPTFSVREAANKAYEQSLAPVHIYVVRTAVWASMYMLPTREQFMKELGETDESAMRWAKSFLACSKDVEDRVMKLFVGINMPVSAPSSNILSALWAGGAAVDAAAS